MWLNRNLSGSVASSIGAAIVLFWASLASAEPCPVTLAEMVGTEVVAKLAGKVDAGMPELAKGASLAPTPEEVVATAQETIPNIVRGLWLDPTNPYPVMMADAYAGENITSNSPDVFAIPGGPRVVCHLLPSVAVFLSDGSNFHYAVIGAVDYQAETVTLADPWAKVSFLRKGFNQAEVVGEVLAAPDGTPRMRLSFADFAKVFRGEIDSTANAGGFSPVLTFDALARIYPEIADSEAFLFWRYSRLISQLDPTHGVDVLAELGQRPDLEAKPSLRLLADAAGMMQAIRSNYGVLINVVNKTIISPEDEPDTPKRAELIEQVRDSIKDYLPALADAFPSVLMLRLIESARESDDLELRQLAAEVFLARHPDDLDLMIIKAQTLLEVGDDAGALAQLDAARGRWKALITQVVATSAGADPVAWFEATKLRLVTFNLMHWRRARIELLSAITKAGPGKPSNLVATLDAVANTYDPMRSHGLAFDFPGLMLWLAWRNGDVAAERGLITNAIDTVPEGATRNAIALALLEHARFRHGLKDMLAGDWSTVRASFLKPMLCARFAELPKIQLITDNAFVARRGDLAEFCQ